MKIKVLEKTENEIRFVLEESNPQFANALRRIMMGEVPILAIDSLDFSENDSVLYNEVIAHRLALIPLVFNLKDFNSREECKCEGKGCSNCQVVFAISKKGPSIVYSKDLKSNNKDVTPLFENIPVVELFEDQKLKLEATAILGFGKNHAKWQASVASYRYYPGAELTGRLNNPDECVKICPKNALKINGKPVVNENCDLCKCCEKVAEPKVLKITGDNTKFIFDVESVSGLKVEEIVTLAADILKKKAKDFEKEIGKV